MAKVETVKVVCDGGYKVINKKDMTDKDKEYKEKKK